MDRKTRKQLQKKQYVDRVTNAILDIGDDIIDQSNQVWESTKPKKSRNRIDIPIVRNLPVRGSAETILRKAVGLTWLLFASEVEDLNAELNHQYKTVILRKPKSKVVKIKDSTNQTLWLDEDLSPF